MCEDVHLVLAELVAGGSLADLCRPLFPNLPLSWMAVVASGELAMSSRRKKGSMALVLMR